MTTKEIQEIKKPVYLPFDEALKSMSMDEIYRMAEAGYLLQIKEYGGVIDE